PPPPLRGGPSPCGGGMTPASNALRKLSIVQKYSRAGSAFRLAGLERGGFGKRAHQMIEAVAGAGRLRGEIAPVMRVDGRVERHAPFDLDAGAGEAVDLGRIVGHQPYAGAAEHVEHARGDRVVALVVVEAERGVGVDGVEPLVLQLIGA